MMRQPELWLMSVALFLYFFDAVILIRSDQALVALGRRGWQPRFGMREWTIGGKEPLLPNPLTSFRPAYLVHWHLFAQSGSTPPHHRLDETLHFKALGVAVVISTVCLFVLLPLGLFTRAGSVLTVFTAVLITLNNLVALMILFRQRELLGIDIQHWATLAAECLLCPPFSLNLVSKVCALQTVDENLESIATRLFAPVDIATMQDGCLARIDDALLSLLENAPEEHSLRESRRRFEPEVLKT